MTLTNSVNKVVKKFFIQKLQLSQVFFRHLSTNCFLNSSQKSKPEASVFQSVIGLEVHAQIASDSKLFSSSSTSYIAAANSQVALFDAAFPGTLPVLNRRCVEAALLTGLALNCQIPSVSSFDRKHYFYADLPAGYQITQQRQPIAVDGFVEFIVYNTRSQSYLKRCRLKQIQLEQDSGKSLQDEMNSRSLVDLNRAGIGLMEFVFEPDLVDPNEAVCLVKELILILKRIQTCTCKMNEGVLRVDANISVHKPGHPLGVRTEVKNLNSFRFMEKAIKFEIERQIKVIKEGNEVINETRTFDNKLGTTIPMRDKEVVQDYRFMPEPNLPPILIVDHLSEKETNSCIDLQEIKKLLPSLTSFDRHMLASKYSLDLGQIFVLMNEPDLLQLFAKVVDISQTEDKSAQIFAFLNLDLRSILENNKSDFAKCLHIVDKISEVIDLLFMGEISFGTAYDVVQLLFQDKRSPSEIVDGYGWRRIKDKNVIKNFCLKAIEANKKIAKRYAKNKIRKPKSVLVQHVFSATNNRLNEDEVWQCIDELIFCDKVLGDYETKN